MNDFLKSLDTTDELPIVSTLQKSIQQWSIIQNQNNCSSPLLKSVIEKLEPGDFLPPYLHAQNAAILIEIDKNSPNPPLISSWQVLLPRVTVIVHYSLQTYSTDNDHIQTKRRKYIFGQL
jgi:hypothetical protein